MVVVAQLVRAPDCGSGGRRFETDLPPKSTKLLKYEKLFLCLDFIVFVISGISKFEFIRNQKNLSLL